MVTIRGRLTAYPARASALWYLTIILLGSFLLRLPISQRESGRVPYLDCLFTATSATCVTGLYPTAKSLGEDFSGFGQGVILLLIQIGGVGIMTITTVITLQVGGRARLRERVALAETLGSGEETDLRWVLRNVLVATAAFEGAGFFLLAVRNLFDAQLSFLEGLWHALFHSISAFCNAGFGLRPGNMTDYQGDVLVNGTVMSLVICGGIGFPVMLDLRRHRRRGREALWERLHLHSKVMFLGTAILLLVGTVTIFAFECDEEVMADMSWPQKVMVSLFHSVSCRTAGFNSVDIGLLTNASLFVMILLMMIGGGPCSTAGGFKVSTLMALVFRAWASFRGQRVVNVFRRTVPAASIDRAGVTALLYATVAGVGLTILLALEQSSRSSAESKGVFLEAIFEVFSALGTVGLSTGLTPRLGDTGKIVIMLLMYIGRLGPIAATLALSQTGRDRPIEYPQEEPLIG